MRNFTISRLCYFAFSFSYIFFSAFTSYAQNADTISIDRDANGIITFASFSSDTALGKLNSPDSFFRKALPMSKKDRMILISSLTWHHK